MVLVFRDEKGVNLTPDEVDGNFRDLDGRVEDLETNPPLPVSIDTISVSGSQMSILLSNGDVEGPFTLPVATFAWRGGWAAGRTYFPLDEVVVGGVGRVLVLQQHTAVAPFDLDRTISGNDVYFLLEELGIIFGDPITDSRELTIDDARRYFLVEPGTAGDPVVLEVPPESSENPWQPGDTISFEQRDPTTGQVTIQAGIGVTVNTAASLQSRTQYSVISLLYEGGDVWVLTGDLEISGTGISLEQVSDVEFDTAGPQAGDLLRFDGAMWVNSPEGVESRASNDAPFSLTPWVDKPNQMCMGTLTAHRAITLNAGYDGAAFWIARTGGGAFNLTVAYGSGGGSTKNIAQDQWALFKWADDVSYWHLMGSGSL